MMVDQKSQKTCVIGIDTSCYTTSVAVVDDAGVIQHDGRQMLDVKPGELGLRQSDAFFKHVQNLPSLTDSLFNTLELAELRHSVRAVAVSSQPRQVDGSYMPVFTAGVAFAKVLASALNVPLIQTDHQSGHIMAGCLSSGFAEEAGTSFVALHMSGGTTEIVRCTQMGSHYSEVLVGGTKDLSMGSLIDRLGVKCGMPFPSGSHMEKLVSEALGQGAVLETLKFPLNHKEGWFNLSGMEAYCLKYLNEASHEVIFYSLFTACADVLGKALSYVCQQETMQDVLVVGGVASNHIIRERLKSSLGQQGIRVHFAEPKLSTDNAVGVAAIGCQSMTSLT